MNKKVKVVLNVLIVIASLVCLVLFVNMIASVRYANRKVEDPAESERRVFEYELEHKSYGEVMETYYARRLFAFEPQPGLEDIYNVAQYAHAAFMAPVYEQKGDEDMIRANADRLKAARDRLGDYVYTADEVDELIRNAP